VVEEALAGNWIIESPPHAKQADGLSCGVYVLMVSSSPIYFFQGFSYQCVCIYFLITFFLIPFIAELYE